MMLSVVLVPIKDVVLFPPIDPLVDIGDVEGSIVVTWISAVQPLSSNFRNGVSNRKSEPMPMNRVKNIDLPVRVGQELRQSPTSP